MNTKTNEGFKSHGLKSILYGTLIFVLILSLSGIVNALQVGPSPPSANGGGNWDNEGNAYASDNTWAVANDRDDVVAYYNFSFSIPAGANITGINVTIEGYHDSGSTRQVEISLSWNGGSSYTSGAGTGLKTTAVTTSEANYTLGGASDTGGRSWSSNQFNNTNFRVKLDATGGGNNFYLDLLRVTVYYAICGNGITGSGEDCDDGNSNNSDACLNTCVAASCPDGYIQSGVEDCDDGNSNNNDACLNTCVDASCGDGFVWGGIETCDGNYQLCNVGGLPGTQSCNATCSGWNTCTKLCNVTLLDDGFEGIPWNGNWLSDDWTQNSVNHSGNYSARANEDREGYLRNNGLNTSDAIIINVSFWYMLDDTEEWWGDYDFGLWYYDGTGGSDYDFIAYLGDGSEDTWLHYTDTITDSQYFLPDFRIYFDTYLGDDEHVGVDDVVITKFIMCGGCTPTTEVCDGIDNDCDTLVDEELGNTTCGVGACTNTTDNCIGGIPQTCTPLQPTPEVCNNIDDDCDGQIDNFTQAASNIFGLCFNNTETCSLGVWYNSTSNYVPANESCDTFDNDCDNQTDERVCPRKMKNESIPLIQALNKTTSPVINSNLLSTILSINNSLAPNLWINDTHINRIRGGIVFDQEKKAVELMTAIKNDRQTPANVKGVCDVVIPTLVEADRLLAQAAIDYAKAAPPGNPTEIANADADMTMALTYLTAGKPNLAVLSYRQAWVHAINAKA